MAVIAAGTGCGAAATIGVPTIGVPTNGIPLGEDACCIGTGCMQYICCIGIISG